uniref:Uncharacterized protein n=1 Tax=Ditylenchus dipsaci TaxID=166011 RepID=A0A915DNT8_9BILA
MSDLKNKMTSFLKYPVYYPVLLNKMFEDHGYLTDGHAVKKSEDKLADCLKNLMSLLIEAKVPEGDIAVPKNESLKGMLDVLEEISAKNTILGSHVYLLYLMVAGFYSQIDTLFLSVRYGNVALSKEKYWSHAERSAIQVDYLCSNLWMFDPITNTSNEFSGIDIYKRNSTLERVKESMHLFVITLPFKKDKLEKIVSPLDQEYKQWSGIDSVIISGWPDKEPNPSLEVHEFNNVVKVEQRPHRTIVAWTGTVHLPHSGTNDVIKSHTHVGGYVLKAAQSDSQSTEVRFLYNICMNKNIGSRKDELAEQEVELPRTGKNTCNGTAKTSFGSMEELRLINEHVCRQSPNAFVRREVVARVKTAAMTEFGSSSIGARDRVARLLQADGKREAFLIYDSRETEPGLPVIFIFVSPGGIRLLRENPP